MRFAPRLTACIPALMLLTSAGLAHAESTLRIGLGSDPDMLDPATARTYYGVLCSAPCVSVWWMSISILKSCRVWRRTGRTATRAKR
ncbi:hypothetical protein SRABI106_03575 [Rahnella aquatilis]|nr:hypothetical protein SRABI106_03575 [Rahnella aquatilis]